MTIFTFAAVVIVIGWFALTALFWASFKEDEQVHPIDRSGVGRNLLCHDESMANSADAIEGKTHYCKCNIAGDRPKRPLYVKKGRTFCARCKKPVNLCPVCGVLREPCAKTPCDCENEAHAA